MKILSNHRYALVTGVVLALILAYIINAVVSDPIAYHNLGLARWVHIVAGVFWIGLLYYFNAVQTPALAAATADKGGPGGAGISKYVAPRALFWFRWSALVTWLSGAWYLGARFPGAFSLGLTSNPVDYYLLVIGIGAWLGTIMLFNVWVLIWPNQKKVLGIVAATDEQKAAARVIAGNTSRVNFILSFPLLMCMAGATHGLPF
ncbi:MAG TPA: urate hydroxylase PuuD [Steroidobacteraceae bacterium]|nr:urate hydroxylase PuuD [Steroidobacteraceae bacterium]HNS27679.1 urate hydroxylase PuuD [Steroidobacteraceae bacterium]